MVRFAFELARQRRKRLASVDKANILASSRLWREIAGEFAAQYKDVAFENVLVDSMAMHLIRRPRDFDVIVTENMFGDILTDEASMLAGSMGLLPRPRWAMKSMARGIRSAYTNRFTAALRISQARTRPTAGRNFIGRDAAGAFARVRSEAEAIRHAVDVVVHEGYRTPDLGRPGARMVGCKAMGRLVREKLEGAEAENGRGARPRGQDRRRRRPGAVGEQIVELIDARALPCAELALFATERGATQTVEALGEAIIVAEFHEPAELSRFDIAFLAVAPSWAADIVRARPGPLLVDLSAALRAPSEVPSMHFVAPGFIAGERIAEFAASNKVVAIAHPAAHALATIISAAGAKWSRVRDRDAGREQRGTA